MRRYNFQEMSSIGKNRNRVKELGSFIQDIENQLWDGHPHIYPNLRIFLEEWCDLIIDVGIGLKIGEEKTGKSRREIHQYYDKLVANNRMIKELHSQEMVVKGNAWSFSLKIRTVEDIFREKGINVDRWGLTSHSRSKPNHNNLKDKLNERAHIFTPISENRDKAFKQFKARFGILRIIHDGVYKDFLEEVLNVTVEPYLMPNKMDILGMLNNYYGGQIQNN